MYNYFFDAFYWGLLFLVLIESFSQKSISASFSLYKANAQSTLLIVLFVVLPISFWMGFRPATSQFGDTLLYQGSYEQGLLPYTSEPVFNFISYCCISLGLSSQWYFSLIAFLYILLPFLFLASRIKSRWCSLLFILGSFSFLGYGINGIRNGLSLSLLIFSFLFISNSDERDRLFPLSLTCLLSVGIHNSAIIPIVCLFASVFLIKDIKQALLIWVIAIPVSIVAGSAISPLFLGLGFDDRLDSYLLGGFTKGFRWDFILYSVVPIYFAYYITKKGVKTDRLYRILINTYTLSNAFWILIIKASFSNRFAYLSWFMYPIVIAYPLLNFNIWKNQKKKAGIILLLYYSFTFIMYLIGK